MLQIYRYSYIDLSDIKWFNSCSSLFPWRFLLDGFVCCDNFFRPKSPIPTRPLPLESSSNIPSATRSFRKHHQFLHTRTHSIAYTCGTNSFQNTGGGSRVTNYQFPFQHIFAEDFCHSLLASCVCVCVSGNVCKNRMCCVLCTFFYVCVCVCSLNWCWIWQANRHFAYNIHHNNIHLLIHLANLFYHSAFSI